MVSVKVKRRSIFEEEKEEKIKKKNGVFCFY